MHANSPMPASRLMCLTLALAIPITSGGCATIISGTKDDVLVTSTPDGAKIKVDKGAAYTTPASLHLKRNDGHTLLVSHAGYYSERVKVHQTINPLVFGNIIFGGILGLAVDLISGGAASLTPHNIAITLEACPPGHEEEVRDWNPPKKVPATDAAKTAGNVN